MDEVGRKSSLRAETASPASVQFSCRVRMESTAVVMQRHTAGLRLLVALILRHDFELAALRGRRPLQIGAPLSASMCTTSS